MIAGVLLMIAGIALNASAVLVFWSGLNRRPVHTKSEVASMAWRGWLLLSAAAFCGGIGFMSIVSGR